MENDGEVVRKITQKSTLPENEIRLEKHMAQSGLSSRREAKSMIVDGFVKVNGVVVTNPGHGIDISKDKIEIEQNGQAPKEYILLYKPRGIETNKTNFDLEDIHDLFPQFSHLSPIGRLDAMSEGLIILSNDGTLAKSLTQIDSKVGKTYFVRVKQIVDLNSLDKMAKGLVIDEKKTKPAVTKMISEHTFHITLHEGRKHQIRLMSQYFEWDVTQLVRIAIGNISIKNMRAGDWRDLTKEEVELLKKGE